MWAIRTIAELSPVMVSDLALRMHLHPATVVGILNRLELPGLIKRVRTQGDGRIVNVELTEKGKTLVEKAPKVHQDLLVAGLEALPRVKLQEIAVALEALVSILGAQELPPRLVLSPEVNLPRQKKSEKRYDESFFLCMPNPAEGMPLKR